MSAVSFCIYFLLSVSVSGVQSPNGAIRYSAGPVDEVPTVGIELEPGSIATIPQCSDSAEQPSSGSA
jgi:hypothetical protein